MGGSFLNACKGGKRGCLLSADYKKYQWIITKLYL